MKTLFIFQLINRFNLIYFNTIKKKFLEYINSKLEIIWKKFDQNNMVPIVHKIKVQWHTFWLSGLLYCLIEMFVPHKISFFLSHWYTATTRITSNFNRARSHKTYFVDILLLLFFCFLSCPSLSCLCFTEHIYMKRCPTGAHVGNYEKNECAKSENESKNV